MPSEFDVAYVVGTVAVVSVLAIAGYTALGIRRTLANKSYRSQALGVGLIAGVLAVNLLNNLVYAYIPPNTPYDTINNNLGPIGTPLYVAFLFVLFYWIDESVLASRRADPRLRDTLRWSAVRKVMRPWVALSAIIVTVTFIAYEAMGNASSATGVPPAFLAPFLLTIILGVPIMGIALLPLCATRARDPLLRRQLYWFGAFAVAYLAGGFLGGIPNQTEAVLSTIPDSLLAGFFLYLSAKALVPIYHFSSEAPKATAS